MKSTTLPITSSISDSPLRRMCVVVALAGLSLLPTAQAVSPAPDGGYSNGNTAEGDFALQNLTTGDHNTAIGNGALLLNTTGSQNVATGAAALFSNTTGFQNVATGAAALFSNTTGFHNTATGIATLISNTIGNHNTAYGDLALASNTMGNFNTVEGAHALAKNTTGDLNIVLGFFAGQNLTTGSNNIDISNGAVAGESNIIRIGNQVAFTDLEGTMHAAHTKTFIAGISGVTLPSGVQVVVDTDGQLGITATSSARFKDEIKPMDKASEAILALKPVTFYYKKVIDPKRIAQFGLVAEEVEKVNPDLVTRDKKGALYTVRYDAVNAMLLNEFLKEHKTVQEQGATMTQQRKDFEAAIAQQQKQIEALTATVKEQATQIQKVSAQLATASQSLADSR